MDRALRTAIRKDPAARTVIAAWRKLTGGAKVRDADRRTLLACSGGADSSALAVILAATGDNLVLAHILHDLRPLNEANADREAAKELAGALGLPFLCRRATIRAKPGNAEANARAARYALLTRIAIAQRCPFIVTAHHADDQAETVLMRLLAGAGPQGLSGVRPRRRLSPGLQLIRPMLGITRADAERICRTAKWQWATDKTNTDTTRLRAAVRTRLMPIVRDISPRSVHALTRSAELQADASRLIRGRAALLARNATQARGQYALATSGVSGQPGIVIGDTLRLLYQQLLGEGRSRRLTSLALDPVVRSIRAAAPTRVRFDVGRATITVTPKLVTLAAAKTPTKAPLARPRARPSRRAR